MSGALPVEKACEDVPIGEKFANAGPNKMESERLEMLSLICRSIASGKGACLKGGEGSCLKGEHGH